MKKRKLCMIFLLCLALMTLVAGCRSKKETNDQGNQKGTAIGAEESCRCLCVNLSNT